MQSLMYARQMLYHRAPSSVQQDNGAFIFHGTECAVIWLAGWLAMALEK